MYLKQYFITFKWPQTSTLMWHLYLPKSHQNAEWMWGNVNVDAICSPQQKECIMRYHPFVTNKMSSDSGNMLTAPAICRKLPRANTGGILRSFGKSVFAHFRVRLSASCPSPLIPTVRPVNHEVTNQLMQQRMHSWIWNLGWYYAIDLMWRK